ncbi:hypothetical protein CMQ_8230 [Grosmannia clavigera kw1407]|uniref:Uncharacterized protein n=1 Tax=Grosmannia clavigera (strain kw1407 / UAMH 11150) TaxID=655863 RepID=F0XKU5_GROCL|nr:uncharacterized protein CMQ_8230 [Grosmannia clavigera kw1407]EFX01764.1 hypothetical protein CMQ_8230 [Grosmannia clavigera kw1407]
MYSVIVNLAWAIAWAGRPVRADGLLDPPGRQGRRFYAEILNAIGISKNKIGFGLYTDVDSCSGSENCWNTGYRTSPILRRWPNVLDAAGNATMDVYTVVDDPANAPLAIVDLIMAPLALADVAIVARAAELRRGMSAKDLAKSKVTKGTGKCTA